MRWFGHVEKMEEECLVKKIVRSNATGVRSRGRPRGAPAKCQNYSKGVSLSIRQKPNLFKASKRLDLFSLTKG